MDLNDFWQEHKGFVLSLVIGLVVFLIGFPDHSGEVRFDQTQPGHQSGQIGDRQERSL